MWACKTKTKYFNNYSGTHFAPKREVDLTFPLDQPGAREVLTNAIKAQVPAEPDQYVTLAAIKAGYDGSRRFCGVELADRVAKLREGDEAIRANLREKHPEAQVG